MSKISNIEKHIVDCPSCGKKVLDHMIECPFCGGALQPLGYKGVDPANLKKIRRTLWILLGAAAMTAVIVFIASST